MSLVRLMSCGFLNILRRFGNHGITSPLAQKIVSRYVHFHSNRLYSIEISLHENKQVGCADHSHSGKSWLATKRNSLSFIMFQRLFGFLRLKVIFQAVPSSVLQVTASQDWDKLERQRRWPGTEGDRRRMARVRPSTGAHRMPASSALLHLSSTVPQIQLPDQLRHCFCSSFTSFGRSLFFSSFFFFCCSSNAVSFRLGSTLNGIRLCLGIMLSSTNLQK